MAPYRTRDPRKEQQWRRWIDQWRASGLSVGAFCTRHGLTQPSFYAWRRRLQRQDAEPPAFVPVRVVPDDAPAADGRVDVLLRDGRSIRVGPGFDPTTLRQVLAVLEGGRSC
jgi:transposase